MRPSQQFKRDAELVYAFREAYVALLNSTRPHQPRFITQLGPAVPIEEWNRLRHAVSVAAGAAGPAYHRHRGTFALRNAAYVMSGVDPVANWEMSLRDPEQLAPETIISAVEAAIGAARQKAAEAKDRERGLVGLIAAFLRWPSELREAVGPGQSAQRAAAGVLGVLAQLLVGILGSVIATGLVALGVAVWRRSF